MAIQYDRERGIISLHTKGSTYQMQIAKYGYLLHLYYGRRLQGDTAYLLTYYDRGFSANPYESRLDKTYSMDALPQEYSCYGSGDFRSSAFEVADARGVYGCDLRYESCEILEGKYAIPGLPAVYCEDAQSAGTLIVRLADERLHLTVELYYGVIEELDVITRAVCVKNTGTETITIAKAASGMLDFPDSHYDVVHFHGRHGNERHMERVPLAAGRQSFGSRRGASSHQHNPFVILAGKDATEDYGDCYGMALLYSGNFVCEVEQDQYRQTRMLMGIMDEMFAYPLKAGESFWTPEAAMTYAQGFSELSWNYHRLVRKHICRGAYRDIRRPVLINNWEATYFDFTGDKIVRIAEEAAALGVEMLVLDDGWFGVRDGENSGLGDWYVNEKKLGGTLGELAARIGALGMKFGLWIEPEAVSEDSTLFREHPEWAFRIPGKKPVMGRNQLVLDFSREEVVDCIFERIAAVIESADISYIKMDMNRSITDVYTATDKCQNQGAILYRYVRGVYAFLEKLLARFPNLLIEGCCGGGGRFDMGMLYYTPQIWCSDNTDAIERIAIQYGTSFGYPVSAMGAHVSAVPNHQTGRTTPIGTRAAVAMAGTFGYELDLSKVTGEEKALVRGQIEEYKKRWRLTHEGRYYRLSNPEEEREYAAWELAADDGSEALVTVVTLDTHCTAVVPYIHMKGLKPEAVYREEGSGRTYSGAALMYAGFPVPVEPGEYHAFSWHFAEENSEK